MFWPQSASVLLTRFLRCEPGFNCCSSRESNEPKQANPLVLDFFSSLSPLSQHSTQDKPGRRQSRRNPVRLPAALVEVPGTQARNHVQRDGNPACRSGKDLSFCGRHNKRCFSAFLSVMRAIARGEHSSIGPKSRRTGGTTLGTQSDGLRKGPARRKTRNHSCRKAVTAAITLDHWPRKG